MIKHCPNFTAFLIGTPIDGDTKLLTRARCKQWSCDYCAEINASMWRAHLLQAINTGDYLPHWYMLTITASGKDRTPAKTLTDLQDNWGVIVQLYRDQCRRMGQQLSYVRIFERHKDGSYHLHALINTVIAGMAWYTDKLKSSKAKGRSGRGFARLKDYTAGKGLGHQVDIKKITPYQDYDAVGVAVSYVLKYMTKDAQAFTAPKHMRRVATSRNLAMQDYDASGNYDWDAYTTFTAEDIVHNAMLGYDVYDIQQHKILTSDDDL